MGIAERRAREKEALRRAILDAATALIVESGYPSLSLRKIAERIEHAPSTIYLYFRDKLDILTAITQVVFGELTERLEALAASETDALTGLRKGLDCYIRFGLEHPQHYVVTFSTPYPTDDCNADPEAERCKAPAESGLRCFDCLRRAIQRGMDQGQLAPGDVDLVSQAVWTSIHGLTILLITMSAKEAFPWVPRDQLIDFQLDMLIRGIAAPDASTSSPPLSLKSSG
jgi:AcrR family transcriptional regulator